MKPKHTPKPVHFEHRPVVDRRGNARDGQSKFEKYFHSTWRPAMGWIYMLIILFDFLIAPTAWYVWQTAHWQAGQVISPWTSVTLANGGLFHVAMGAIVGITAYSRGKEKASPWAMMQPSASVTEIADNRTYIDPERRFG